MSVLQQWLGASNGAVITLMGYAAAIAIPGALAASLGEQLLQTSARWRARARLPWFAAIAMVVALTGIAAFAPRIDVAPVTAMRGEGGALASTTSPVMSADAPTPPPIDVAGATSGGRVSGAATARRERSVDLRFLLFLPALLVLSWCATEAVRLRRLRARWQEQEVDGTSVLISDHFGPAVVGVVRPRIVLPASALALSPFRRSLVLQHEQEHVRAGDTRLVFAALLLVAACAWNPVVWWMYHRLRLAVELDCDQRVLRRSGDAHAYGILLLDVAATRGYPPFVTALLERASWLARRIECLAMRRVHPRRTVMRSGAATGAVALAMMIPSPSVALFAGRAAVASPPASVIPQPPIPNEGAWYGRRFGEPGKGVSPLRGWAVVSSLADVVSISADPSRAVADRADIVILMQAMSTQPTPGGIVQTLDARLLRGGQYVLRGEMSGERLAAPATASVTMFDRCGRAQNGITAMSSVGNSGWSPFQLIFNVLPGADHYTVRFTLPSNGVLRVRRLQFEALHTAIPLRPLTGPADASAECRSREALLGGEPESTVPQDLRFVDLTLTLPLASMRGS